MKEKKPVGKLGKINVFALGLLIVVGGLASIGALKSQHCSVHKADFKNGIKIDFKEDWKFFSN